MLGTQFPLHYGDYRVAITEKLCWITEELQIEMNSQEITILSSAAAKPDPLDASSRTALLNK